VASHAYSGHFVVKPSKGEKKNDAVLRARAVSLVIVRNSSTCHRSMPATVSSTFCIFEYDEPHNRSRPTFFFHGPSQDRRRWEKPHVLYHLATCSEHRLPTKETAPLASRLCPPVHTNFVDAASTHVQTSHRTPLWIFASMLVRQGGVHSASHGLTLCTCKLSGRDAVMMLSS
jgi:hypothetical protein